MAVDIVITNQGRAALVNAQNTGTAPVTITQVGVTATAFAAALTATTLPGEIKRIATIAGEVVADDTIHVNVTDSSADVYDMRGFALYLADGTLFALYGQAAPLLSKSAESIGAVAIDVVFADILAASLTFGDATFTNPPATTERSGVVELATLAEAQVGIDALRALTPAGARAAVLGWLLAQDGAGSGLDADLLDGQQGAWYADVPARLGYTPLNAATYTALDIRTKLLTVDGPGSGLDADLLDGQQGAWYADIAARLGYTPLNTTAYTALDVRAKLLTVDGSGSGVDADLLNGQEGSFYTNIPARLGYTPLNAATYTAPDVLAKLLGVDGAGSGLDADLLDGQQGAWYADIAARLGYTPLNAANYTAADVLTKLLGVDGAGSGLDADLLDGLNGAQYLRIVESQFAPNGYVKFSNGLYVMWGTRAFNGGGSPTTVNYAAELGAAVALSAFSIALVNCGRTADTDANPAYVTGCDINGFSAFNRSSAATTGFWIAIGF